MENPRYHKPAMVLFRWIIRRQAPTFADINAATNSGACFPKPLMQMGINELLIKLNADNMKQLVNLFLDDIKIENFDKIEKVVMGVVAPALLIALCVALSFVQTLISK